MIRSVLVVLIAALTALGVVVLPPPTGAIAAVVAVLLVAGAGLRWSRSDTETLLTSSADESRAELPVWLESAPVGLLLLDTELTVVAANSAAASMLNRPQIAMLGVTLIRATLDHNLVQVAREAAGVPREVDLRDRRIVRATASRLPETVREAGLILALEDLTELRRAQRARSELVANASHELRTPVAAAMALAETLEEGVAEEDRRAEFHHRLTEELNRLAEVIDGLLHLSRLEARTEEFEIQSLTPQELLDTAARRIEPLLRPEQHITTEPQSRTAVAADRERVLEVLANLLDNALRVTPETGTVTMGAFDGQDEVRFEVRDEGPGILPHDRERIFERFYTGDAARTSDADNSSGLGLAIARHIIARLGGRIWVADRNPGATLCFTLPAFDATRTSESARRVGTPAAGAKPTASQTVQ